MDVTNVALGLGWLVAFGGGALMIALRESGDAVAQLAGGFDKWAEHLRVCPARKPDSDLGECTCGLTDFRAAISDD